MLCKQILSLSFSMDADTWEKIQGKRLKSHISVNDPVCSQNSNIWNADDVVLMPCSLTLKLSGDLKFASRVIRIKLSKRLSRAYTLAEEHCGIFSSQQCIHKKFQKIKCACSLRTSNSTTQTIPRSAPVPVAQLLPETVLIDLVNYRQIAAMLTETSNPLKQNINQANADACSHFNSPRVTRRNQTFLHCWILQPLTRLMTIGAKFTWSVWVQLLPVI